MYAGWQAAFSSSATASPPAGARTQAEGLVDGPAIAGAVAAQSTAHDVAGAVGLVDGAPLVLGLVAQEEGPVDGEGCAVLEQGSPQLACIP